MDAERGTVASLVTEEDLTSPLPSGVSAVLILRAEATIRAPRVHWTPETVDNEHLGRKKSNGIIRCLSDRALVCCIFHPKEDSGCAPSCHADDDTAWNAYEVQPKYVPK
jgi:hypothetical protein